MTLWGLPFVLVTSFLVGLIIYLLSALFFLKRKSMKVKLIRGIFAFIVSFLFFLLYLNNLANID